MIRLSVNQQVLDINTSGLGLRLRRQISNESNVFSKGGEFTLNLTLPMSENNKSFFKIGSLGQINKFKNNSYDAVIDNDGDILIIGKLRITSYNNRSISAELIGNNSSWIDEFSKVNLQELGYINGEPTWFAPYDGGTTIVNNNNINDNRVIDIVFPTIIYNNTPVTDYLDYFEEDVFGTFDGSGNQIKSPLDFPNVFPLRNGYFGTREGLTFEDFPPAVYYRNVIEKCFSHIGWNIKCDLFNQPWFNKLIIPYTGTGYNWNWRNIGSMRVHPRPVYESHTDPFFDGPEFENMGLSFTGVPVPRPAIFHISNALRNDDISIRYDKIANFKKWNVTDDDYGYVCPASGRYLISVSSYQKSSRTVHHTNDYNFIGNGQAGYGWDDQVMIVTRQDQGGNYVLDPNFRKELYKWMNGEPSTFTSAPSDVIMYASPKRMIQLGNNNINSTGSPLTNWQEQILVGGTVTHNIISNTATNKTVESRCTVSVELDLQKNERINVYWITLADFESDLNNIAIQTSENTSETSIDYRCGYMDIDVASNLPSITAQDFISGFVNMFNLQFVINEDSKTVEFITEDTFMVNNSMSLSVDEDTPEISPCDVREEYKFGYNNDPNDNLLTRIKSNCEADVTVDNNYANRIIDSDNPDGVNTLSVLSNFSSTRFLNGRYELIDFDSPSAVVVNTYSQPFEQGFDYGDTTIVPAQLPAIQSIRSFNEKQVADLEYSYDYTPRLLYFLGNMRNDNYRFKINSPDKDVVLNQRHWIKPTLCSFHDENNSTFPSLRMDIDDNSIYQYQTDIKNLYNESYIMRFDAIIDNAIYRKLDGRRSIIYKDTIYKLLSVDEYNPMTGRASLTLIKMN